MGMFLLRPATLPQSIIEVVKVLHICIKRPAPLHQVIAGIVDLGQVLPATIHLAIVEDMLIHVNIGHKRPATLPLSIGEHDLMLKGEVDIGLRPSTITLVTKVSVVYFRLFQEILLVVMGELDIGPRPDTIPSKQVIVGVMVKDVEVGLKRSTTLPCSMLDKFLM